MIDAAALPGPLHFWRCRLTKGGPWVPVLTFNGPPLVEGELLDRSPRWQAVVRLETTGRVVYMGDECPIDVEDIMLRNVERCDEQEWRYLRDHADYATTYRPDLPDASPRTKVDVRGKSVF